MSSANPLARLGRSAGVYVFASILQKGTAFLLLPLYTRFMSPTEYGILAIMQSLTQILIILFTCSLDSAAIRFYYEYRDDRRTLGEFWGSIILTMLLIGTISGGMAVLFGAPLLRPLIGDIAFWPYVVLGIIAAVFQPFISTLLSILQAREEAMRYAAISFSFFLSTLLTTLLLVVGFRWGAEGVLAAIAANTALFGCFSLVALRPHYHLVIRRPHVLNALAYSLPLLPHTLAGMAIAAADRFSLNAFVNAAATGVYNVAFMLGMSVDILLSNLNRAYIPITMSERTAGRDENLNRIRQLGQLLMVGVCLLGAGVASFSSELVLVLTAPAFHGARELVPILAFAGVASGIYALIISNVLFFDRRLTRYVPVGTIAGAGVTIVLNIILIPRLGTFGAAIATLAAFFTMILASLPFTLRHDPIHWPFARFASMYVVAFASSYLVSRMDLGSPLLNIPVKLLFLLVLLMALSTLTWGRPFYAFAALRSHSAAMSRGRR